MALNEAEFESLAAKTLENFFDVIDEALGDVLDADLDGGVLTLELDAGGQYVINKHGPNRQIWMSSPKSGATHYDFDAESGSWRSTRSDAVLSETLATELTAATGRPLTL